MSCFIAPVFMVLAGLSQRQNMGWHMPDARHDQTNKSQNIGGKERVQGG